MSKAKAKGPSVFIPLMKVDEEQRLVYGRITAQELDQSGEVMDYETSKPNFQKWSSDIEEASGGLSKGNLRVMHGLSVAGKLTDLAFNDDDQAIEVCAKVVDDAEWEKVTEGCYTGFSVGGRYGKKWTETENGQTIKKYTAVPNEVSLVDNPCVKSATFALVKADGAEEAVMFKVADAGTVETPATAAEETSADYVPSNDEVARKATQIAEEKADGTSWVDHLEVAREELIKAAKTDGKKKKEDNKDPKESAAEKGADEEPDNDDDDKSAKAAFAVADRLKQVWTTSDGQSFDKKADAMAHEETLAKAAPTEAELLAQRLAKATEAPAAAAEEGFDFEGLGKALERMAAEVDSGSVELRKGMGTVAGFARLLCNMANLSRSIATEGVQEGGDPEDATVSANVKAAIATLGESFKQYAEEQIAELLAGVDDDEYVSFYDYFYNAAHSDGEDALAKSVCSILETNREPSRERRETLAKAFGYVEAELVNTDNEELEELKKSFSSLQSTNEQLTKVATEAVEKVEELAKRVQELADQPMPRAPQNVAYREGDSVNVMGKSFANEVDARAHLHNLVKTMGPDALAVEMIKAAQSGGGQPLHLNR